MQEWNSWNRAAFKNNLHASLLTVCWPLLLHAVFGEWTCNLNSGVSQVRKDSLRTQVHKVAHFYRKRLQGVSERSKMGHSIFYPHPPYWRSSYFTPSEKWTFDPLRKEDQSTDTSPPSEFIKRSKVPTQLPLQKRPLKTPPLPQKSWSFNTGGVDKKMEWPNAADTESAGGYSVILILVCVSASLRFRFLTWHWKSCAVALAKFPHQHDSVTCSLRPYMDDIFRQEKTLKYENKRTTHML